MTTPNSAIKFNNSTGSDTQASGLGPTTAQFGTTGSCTSSSAVVTGITTTGVVAGDLFWGQTSTGRQFSVITTVDSGTQVTLDDTLAATHSGNLTWAIGGKRSTLSNTSSARLPANDSKDGWIIEIEETGSAYTLTAELTIGAAIILRGNTGHVEIRQTADAKVIGLTSGTNVVPFLKKLKITHSNATKTNALGVWKSNGINGAWRIQDCILGDATNQLFNAFQTQGGSGGPPSVLMDCEIKNTTSNGINSIGGGQITMLLGCWIHDCGVSGCVHGSSSGAWVIMNCIIEDNITDGCNFNTTEGIYLLYNTIDGNGGDGVEINAAQNYLIIGNIFSNNGNFGIRGPTSGDTHAKRLLVNFNDFHNNTSGTSSVLALDSDDLTVNPQYVDANNNNFRVGENLKAKGFPKSTLNMGANQSSTISYADIGAVQRQEPENYVKWFGLRR